MTDIAMPSIILDWLNDRNWGEHHLRWHAERQWDRLSPAVRSQLANMGWSRAAIQEGEAGNGLEFLMMHRAMIQVLINEFPGNAALFIGWVSPPADSADPVDPPPTNSPIPGAFSVDMQSAIGRLTDDLASFTDEDELGLYIETRFRPIPGNPWNLAADASAGLHNYLHGRFSDSSSPVDMGNPSLNLGNTRFWKLHGWIDKVWANYRTLKGLSDSDPVYLNALQSEKDAMQGTHHHHPAASLAARASTINRRLAIASLSVEVTSPFRESTARGVQRLMANTPKIETRDDLVAYLQTAIQVEHATLPLYLTAWWSLKENDSATNEHADILYSIAMQEMLHFGIVCNLLTSIGSAPLIIPPDATIPVFPGQLPGLDLSSEYPGDISLEGISLDRIQLFMRIEEPTAGDIDPAEMQAMAASIVPRFRTIGEFYDVIIAGIEFLSAAGQLVFSDSGQVTGALAGLDPISNKDSAIAQLQLIKEQGEGTSSSQASGSAPEELAHFYRFKQIAEQKKYSWATGTPVLDVNLPLPFPAETKIRQFQPSPPSGHPESAAFDAVYTNMLNQLHLAWHGDRSAIFDAVGTMYDLTTEARSLMDRGFGPNFRYIPTGTQPTAARSMATLKRQRTKGQSSRPMAVSTVKAAVAGPVIPGYARIQQILDESVNGESFGAHGPFWRSLSRDQFVAKKIFGRPLLHSISADTFDPEESNLVKALEGRAPFGKNMVPAPPGALWNRMPDGYPPIAQTVIDEIRTWISAGCPDAAPSSVNTVDSSTPASLSLDDYVNFWRTFDNVAMFEATDEVQADVGNFFNVATEWFQYAKNPALEANWDAAISEAVAAQSIRRLEKMQRETIVQTFGIPVRLKDLLTCWELFGDDTLPDDPLRPIDVRHTMNGDTMWFFWAAFVDAALRMSKTVAGIPEDLWLAVGRAVLLGLMNDGVFRGRFQVIGFDATPQGKQLMRDYVASLQAVEIPQQLRLRCVQGGFAT